MLHSSKLLALSAISLAIAFNVPFSILGSIFDYPAILRQPSAVVLKRFHEAGSPLVLTWYGFMLCAILLVPFAVLLSKELPALATHASLSKLAMISGALAGVLQAVGLSRWVFAVPMLASQHVNPNATVEIIATTELLFETLNLWGGVAIGEHLGQIFTCLFVAAVAWAQLRATGKLPALTGLVGFVSVLGIGIGLGEGISIGLQADGSAFSLATVLGYLSFSMWLILTGIGLMKNSDPVTAQPAAGYSKSTM